jgi:secondary thiamine-phosphate synthase enzyme
MRQAQHQLSIATSGKGLVEITPQVKRWVEEQGISTGLLTLYCRHTSASLLIQENADPDLQTDLENFFDEIAPETKPYVHATEGPDDMPAHIRTALTGVQLSIPVVKGVLALGTWQGIYLFEHRRAGEGEARVPGAAKKGSRAPHKREVVMHLIGE